MKNCVDLIKLLNEKRTEILAAAERHGACNVRIFGSVARGDFDDESDLDFLVEMEPGRSLLDHASLLIDLEELLGRKVDVVSDRGIKSRIRESAQRGAPAMRDIAERILDMLEANDPPRNELRGI